MKKKITLSRLPAVFISAAAAFALAFLMALPAVEKSDFFTLWIAAKSLLAGISPYDSSVSELISTHWQPAVSKQSVPFFVYPLPTVMPFLLYGLMGGWTALLAWLITFLLFIVKVGTVIEPEKKSRYAAFVLSYPMVHAISIQTSTVVWAMLVMWLMLENEQPGGSIRNGFLLSLLPLKPQAGLVWFAFIFLRSFRAEKKTALWSLFFTSFWIITSFLMSPTWLDDWLNVMEMYFVNQPVFSMLPWGVFLLLLLFRQPWYFAAAWLQTILFPINDIYCLLMLFPAWFAFRKEIAVPGLGMTWLMPLLFDAPDSVPAFILCGIVPLAAVGAVSLAGKFERYAALRIVQSG